MEANVAPTLDDARTIIGVMEFKSHRKIFRPIFGGLSLAAENSVDLFLVGFF
jgi:hypothetical protein